MLNNFPDNFQRSDEDVLNEFRQKQISFDLEERKNEINRSRSLFIGALSGLVMASVVAWFVLAPNKQNADSNDVPVITRPQGVVKMQPSEPGDIELASQERTVYDIIEKKTTEEDSKVINSEEQPDVQTIERLVDSVAVEVSNNGGDVTESLTKTEKTVVAEKTPSETKVEVVAEETKAVEVAPVKVTEVKPVEKAVEKAEPVKEEPKPVVAAQSGNWQVQLMSSPNKAAVEKSWMTMSKKFDALKNLPHEIESADLGAKGTFYRLKAGAFATKAEAAAACNKIKAVGGSCFTARK